MTNANLPDCEVLIGLLEQLQEHGTPPPGAAALIDVGTDGFAGFFGIEVLDGLVASGGATCRFFQGPYGSGKTHLLQLIEQLGSERGLAVVRLDLSQALGLEDWRLVTKYILENLELNRAGVVHRGFPDVLDALRDDPATDVSTLDSAKLPHPGFKRAIVTQVRSAGLTDDAAAQLHRYLSGERVPAGSLSRLGIQGVKNPLSKRNAEQVLNTVIGGLFHLGIPGTMILFDENEKTFDTRYTNSRRVQLAANLVRRFIDACFTETLTGTVAVFAVLPGFLQACSMVYPALGQRLHVNEGAGFQPGWRWPVLPIEVTGEESPEEFLTRLIKRLSEFVDHCGGDPRQAAEQMRFQGERILQENAGSGYRRPLIKALAAVALSHMEEKR